MTGGDGRPAAGDRRLPSTAWYRADGGRYRSPTPDSLQVLVVGAGVAGLALAGFLRQHGIDPVVVERDDRPGDGRYGLCLWRDGLDVLADLGVAERIREAGRPVERWTVHDGDGSVRTELETPPGARPAAVALDHRQLVDALRTVVRDTSVRYGLSVDRLEQRSDGVSVTFTNGVREPFDVVVGADGVHSTVRELIDGAAATSCGTTTREARVDANALPAQPGEALGSDGSLLRWLPLDDGTALRLSAAATDQGGTERGPLDALTREDGGFEWLTPSGLDVSAADDVVSADDYGVRTDTWTHGGVVLIGDAAHALPPVAEMGATLALEDALVLADELTGRTDDVEARLTDFVGRRRSRIRRLQRDLRLFDRPGVVSAHPDDRVDDALAVRASALETLSPTLGFE